MTSRPATPTEVRQVVLAGMLTMAVVMGIGRFAFTPILPSMRDEFGLSAAALGALASANYLGYMVGALISAAPILHRWRRQVIGSGLVLVIGVTAGMALTTAMPAWLLLRFVAGVASAGVFVFASAAVIGWFVQQKRPELVGFFFSGVGLGIVSSGAVILLVQRVAGGQAWRFEWLASALLAILLAIPTLRWLPRETLGTAAARRQGWRRGSFRCRCCCWPSPISWAGLATSWLARSSWLSSVPCRGCRTWARAPGSWSGWLPSRRRRSGRGSP